MVGTDEDLSFGNIWSRKIYVAAAATPTPTTIASVDTAGIISEENLVVESEREGNKDERRPGDEGRREGYARREAGFVGRLI